MKPGVFSANHDPLKPNAAEDGYNIPYRVDLSLSSSTVIVKRLYYFSFFFFNDRKKRKFYKVLSMMYFMFHSCCRGKLFHGSNLKFLWLGWSLSSLYMNKQGQSLLSVLDTESPVLEGACQSHLRGAPGYITPVSLTSPLRSYFSNVQSALWLLCSSSPSSSHCHSTSKVMFQKPSAISPTKASQKLQIHSPRHLRHGPGLCKGLCHATLYPGLLSPVLLGPDHLTGGLRVILPSGLQRRAWVATSLSPDYTPFSCSTLEPQNVRVEATLATRFALADLFKADLLKSPWKGWHSPWTRALLPASPPVHPSQEMPPTRSFSIDLCVRVFSRPPSGLYFAS